MDTCRQIDNDIQDMSEAEMVTDVTSHKEERTARIRSDAADRCPMQSSHFSPILKEIATEFCLPHFLVIPKPPC